MSILIVEDNATSAMVMQLMLKKAGHESQLAVNGLEALEMLRNDAGIQMIITDIMMPGMDGLAMLREVKASPELREIPVIMTTALADVPKVKEAASMGCKHYLVKPIKMAQLVARVAELIPTEKAVIKSRDEIMEELDMFLDPQTYEKMLKTFRDMLAEQAAFLEMQEKTPDAEPSALPDVVRMHESAKLLGAQRLEAALYRLIEGKAVGATATTRLDHSMLLREIDLVLEKLQSWKT